MCRILSYYGGTSREVIGELLEGLLRVSKHDVIGILSGIDDLHPDGWGTYVRSRSRELYFRSGNAIFNEEDLARSLVRSYIYEQDRILMILHVRAASQGEPHGVEHSHPYMIRDGELKVVLAHNGAVKKREILEELGKEELYAYVTDSMALTMYIFKKLKKGRDITKIIEDVMTRFTKTALMTSIFIEHKGKMRLVITSHVSERAKHRIEYYRLFKLAHDDILVYASSSIAHEISSRGSLLRSINITPLPIDNYYEIIEVEF
ncbi:MAG: hypothetical protein GXO26_07030 [Crenarchaeota archaeon]|nr:hypothetical protein [Thermoproteota archaeon]